VKYRQVEIGVMLEEKQAGLPRSRSREKLLQVFHSAYARSGKHVLGDDRVDERQYIGIGQLVDVLIGNYGLASRNGHHSQYSIAVFAAEGFHFGLLTAGV
jgi:hypothetical protein